MRHLSERAAPLFEPMYRYRKLAFASAAALVVVSSTASPLAGAQVDLYLSDLEAVAAGSPSASFTIHLSPGRVPAFPRRDIGTSTLRVRIRATAHPPDALLALEVPEPREVMVELAAGGESKVVVMDFSTREEWARVRVQVDPLQEIDERDEGNNYGEALFRTPMADGAPEPPAPVAEGMRGPPRPPDFAAGVPGRADPPIAVEDGTPVEVALDLMITIEGPYNHYVLTNEPFHLSVQLYGKLPIGTAFYIHVHPNLSLEGFESDFASCQEASPGPDPPLNQDGTYLLCEHTGGSWREMSITTRPRWSDEELTGLPEGLWKSKYASVSAMVDWGDQLVEHEEGNNFDLEVVMLYVCKYPGTCPTLGVP